MTSAGSTPTGSNAGERRAFEADSVSANYLQRLQPVIFEPWALRLTDYVGVAAGQSVLDVAAGTGAVSRAAASIVGAAGSVIASDVSAPMLEHVQEQADAAGAAITTLVCSATELALADASFDVVLCQQGFPFIPDRAQAAREMARVLRPGGVAGVAVWVSGQRHEPFDSYADAVRSVGVEGVLDRMLDNSKLFMSEAEVAAALTAAGLVDVETTVERMPVRFASLDDAVAGIAGTPFGVALAVAAPEVRRAVDDALRAMVPVEFEMAAVFGRGRRAAE
ncbi:class I SAM-dependent methyltransferase [Lacisediminihabitans sp.]|uniref:class I SAM-dependent methyltransferase n=1 Tax=Lacisediminihabitans sp. TaxID=2787631 RepID=UPI00374D16F2